MTATMVLILLSAIVIVISFVLILLALYKYNPKEWSIKVRNKDVRKLILLGLDM